MPAKRGPGLCVSTDTYLPAHGNGGYRVTHYDLDLDYRPSTGRLAGSARLSAVPTSTLDRFSLDLGAFRIDRVLVDGRAARYTHRAGKLHIRPVRPPRTGFTIEVRYIGTPRPVRSLWGEIGWEQLTDGALVASQPIGAPSWFPCNDHVAEKASYQLTISAPSSYTVLANGTLAATKVGAGSTTWTYSQPEPMPAYLASVQIGRYESVPVGDRQQAAVPARLVSAFSHDFARQPDMLAVFSDHFGPYPFSTYSVVVTDDDLEVPVEAQGLSTFGANHVDGARGFENLVAHELAHQWFGNSLTVADWRHIWLNEGFSTYAEWLWSESSGGLSAAAIATRARAAIAALPQDLILADPGVRRMFDDRVYQRGALTLHALRTTIGDSAFFDLLRNWTASYRHGTVSTEQFTALAARHSPVPLDPLFAAWLYQARLPRFAVGY